MTDASEQYKPIPKSLCLLLAIIFFRREDIMKWFGTKSDFTIFIDRFYTALTSSPAVPWDSKNHFLGFLFPRLGLHWGVASQMLLSMSPEAFNVPMCPTVRSANSSMLIAASQSRKSTKPQWWQRCVLWLTEFLMTSPQLEKFWEV